MMHIDMFPHAIIHAECIGGDIDLLLNRRVQIGFFPWRFVDGEASIGRCVAFVEDDEYEELMAKKESMPKTRFGDAYDPKPRGESGQDHRQEPGRLSRISAPYCVINHIQLTN